MNRAAVWMIAYGVFLIAGALVAISISGWDRSKTALFSSGGAASIMFALAFVATRPGRERLGVLSALMFTLMCAATFFIRLQVNWGKPTEEAWRAANPGVEFQTALVQSPLQNWLFPTFIFGSLVVAVALGALALRPAATVARQLEA